MAAGEVWALVHSRIKLCNHDCYFCAYRSQDMSLGEDMDKRDRIPGKKYWKSLTIWWRWGSKP